MHWQFLLICNKNTYKYILYLFSCKMGAKSINTLWCCFSYTKVILNVSKLFCCLLLFIFFPLLSLLFFSQRSQMTACRISLCLLYESAVMIIGHVLLHSEAWCSFCLLSFRFLSVFLSISERRVDSNDRVYFVNHNTKTTQWEDPRTQGWAQSQKKHNREKCTHSFPHMVSLWSS